MRDLDDKLEDTNALSWDEWYKLLVAYEAEFGDCLIPYFYKTKEGYSLWYWVSKMRLDRPKGLLTEEQIRLLDDLYFIWEPQDDPWEKGFTELRAYKRKYGDCMVPDEYDTDDGYPLWLWVRSQRQFDGNYPREKSRRLHELGFVWNLREYNWHQTLQSLRDYKEEFGDCMVPKDYVTEDGVELGAWVAEQRIDLRYRCLSEDKMQLLDGVGFAWADWGESSPVMFVPPAES